MKQWSQSQIILTAATVPLALLMCWLVYKQTSEKRHKSKEKKNDPQSAEKIKSVPCSDATSCSSDEAVGYQSSILDAVDTDEITYTDSYVNMVDIDDTMQLPNNKPELPQIKESEILSVNSEDIASNNPSDSKCPSGTDVELQSNVICSSSRENVEPSGVESMSAQEPSELGVASAAEELCENVAPVSMALGVGITLTSVSDGPLKENSFPEQLETFSSSEINSLSSFGSDLTSENSQGASAGQEDKITSNVFNAAVDVTLKHEDDSVKSTINESTGVETTETNDCDAITNEPNANNNNNATDSPTHLNDDSASLPRETGSSENNTLYSSCRDDETTSVEINGHEQNGWDSDHKSNHECESKGTHEKSKDREETNEKTKKRPSSLPKLDFSSNGESTMQVHVEFPSDKVGLLIGKQGRNIKQLKQDSGADVYVHAARFRDDIQVLQICGTQPEVESCISRIKRRFNDVTLSPFDPANVCPSSSNSSLKSSAPTNSSPPPLVYTMPNISQLRLPEGLTVDVLVSAIASVDCIFVQQYTHISFHSLENLERAMALCYAEPTTPSLHKPVQAGLICAAPQQGMWYRAQVIQYYEKEEEVVIKFMDYGGYATVSDKSIKQIRADFVHLPFQAIECYLDNIAPPEGSQNDNRYCDDAVPKLAEMLKEGRYQVRVTGYRSDGHPKIHLFKCHNNKVILINQEMAAKGIASWVEPAPFH